MSADSLPLDLQAEWKARRAPVQLPLKLDDASSQARAWWENVLAPIVQHARGTAEYRAARIDLLAKAVCYPDGRWSRIPERTLDRKLSDYARDGSAGLTQRKRRDAGTVRHHVTKRWDEAVSLPDAEKQRIGEAFRRTIRSLHAKGEAVSQIALLAQAWLAEETRRAGCDHPAEELKAACIVPPNRIHAERMYRKLDRHDRDAKAYHDAEPRVMRHREGFAPMSVVVGDVHPVDIYYRRADGSVATAKAVAWLDLATNRIWIDFLFLDKGQGVRAADVVASFARMVAAWGMPRALYLDNGGEYGWSDFINDALNLVDRRGNGLQEVAPWAARRSNVINAIPYNAPAKPIEGIFGLLENLHFKRIDGWIGGDRLRKKSANHGREPVPFSGTVDELRQQLDLCVAFYNSSPQRRSRTLKGQSPNNAFNAAVAAGWGKIALDPDTLHLAFSTEKRRQLRQGGIELGGKRYTCPELQAYQGDTVIVVVPKFAAWGRLPVKTEKGQHLGFAAEDMPYAFLDPDGARESEARKRRHQQGLRKLRRGVDNIDVLALAARTLPPAAPHVPVIGRLSLTDHDAEIVAGVKSIKPPAAGPARPEDALSPEARAIFEKGKRLLGIGLHPSEVAFGGPIKPPSRS